MLIWYKLWFPHLLQDLLLINAAFQLKRTILNNLILKDILCCNIQSCRNSDSCSSHPSFLNKKTFQRAFWKWIGIKSFFEKKTICIKRSYKISSNFKWLNFEMRARDFWRSLRTQLFDVIPWLLVVFKYFQVSLEEKILGVRSGDLTGYLLGSFLLQEIVFKELPDRSSIMRCCSVLVRN